MKRSVCCLIFVMLFCVSFSMAYQEPSPFYCESQGYGAVNSFIIVYESKYIQLVKDPNLGDPIFAVYLNEEYVKSTSYQEITGIYGLSEKDKEEFIDEIKNAEDFGDYIVDEVTTSDYEGYSINGKYEMVVYCNFPDGKLCSWRKHRDDICGTEYRTEIPCVEEGEGLRISYQECCNGLTAYSKIGKEGGSPTCLREGSEDSIPVFYRDPTEFDLSNVGKNVEDVNYEWEIKPSGEISDLEIGEKEEILNHKQAQSKIPFCSRNLTNVQVDPRRMESFLEEQKAAEGLPSCDKMVTGLTYVIYTDIYDGATKECLEECEEMKVILRKIEEDTGRSLSYSDLVSWEKRANITKIPTLLLTRGDMSFMKIEGNKGYEELVEIILNPSGEDFTPLLRLEYSEPPRTINPDEPVTADSVGADSMGVSCTGCLIKDKCYSIGHRKDGKYCTEEGNFTEYKIEEKECENNFECKSNVCVDGVCVKAGFFKKIFNWFGELFN